MMFSALKQFIPKQKISFQPRNKTALITGGAEGIGWEVSKQLHEQGANVVIVDRDTQAAQQAALSLNNNALVITADVTDRVAMQNAIEEATQRFGRLDLVVANAGITPSPATLRTSNLNDFDRVMAVNVTGVLNTVHPAIESLIQHQGHIVVVASCAAFCPPMAGAAYMVSKAATEQLARGLKLELAPYGVTVTTAYFGVVDTQLAKATLDNDPIGQSLNNRLPTFLRKRLTPENAGKVLLKAIQQRLPIIIAPTGWTPYSWLRGMANPLLDKLIINDPSIKTLLQELELRNKPNTALQTQPQEE